MLSVMSLPTVDLESIENLRSLSPDDGDVFLREILTIFLHDTPARIAELHKGLTSGAVANFVRAAHSIKGSSSNVGASELRALAESLEYEARTNGLANLESSVTEVEGAFDRVRDELKKLMAT